MVLGGNDREILGEIIKQQKIDNKRIERLETLEFEKAAKSNGCISWLDYTLGAGASLTVNVPPNPFELGDYGWTQLTIWYSLTGYDESPMTLHMTFNAIAANYAYNYKWTRGIGPQTSVGAEGQTSFIIANMYPEKRVTGWVQIPYYSVHAGMNTWADWTTIDTLQAAGSQIEKGEFGGQITTGAAVLTSATFFASAGNISGPVYLYGWCPTWTVGQGPPD